MDEGSIKVLDILKGSTDTFNERNDTYGSTFLNFGKIMKVLYPNGLMIEDVNGWNRLAILMQIITKLMRHTKEPGNPHIDSIHDVIVYAAMEEMLSKEAYGMKLVEHLVLDKLEQATAHQWCHQEDIVKEAKIHREEF